MAKMNKLPDAWAGTSKWRSIKKDDPKRMAKLAAVAILIDLERRNLDRLSKTRDEEVREIKKILIEDFDKADIKEIKTKYGTARLAPKDIPVTDPDSGGWEATYAYIIEQALTQILNGTNIKTKNVAKYVAKHGFWDILHKRLGERACAERWEQKEKIPGVKQFQQMDMKLGDAE